MVEDPIGAHLDLLAVNTYMGWYGRGLPDIIAHKSWETVYDKPMIFSEFGAGALHGYHGTKQTRWSEEYQQFLY